LRVESNFHPHHHLVCMRCKSITDLEHADLKPSRLRAKLPRGFQVKRIAVDILGVCATCASPRTRKNNEL